jgi:hypothetical protein
MKTKTLKSRVMWANYYPTIDAPVVHPVKQSAIIGAVGITKTIRVAVIPLDDVEALVEMAAKAIFIKVWPDETRWDDRSEGFKDAYRNEARAALTAIGIPCKRKARK